MFRIINHFSDNHLYFFLDLTDIVSKKKAAMTISEFTIKPKNNFRSYHNAYQRSRLTSGIFFMACGNDICRLHLHIRDVYQRFSKNNTRYYILQVFPRPYYPEGSRILSIFRESSLCLDRHDCILPVMKYKQLPSQKNQAGC